MRGEADEGRAQWERTQVSFELIDAGLEVRNRDVKDTIRVLMLYRKGVI